MSVKTALSQTLFFVRSQMVYEQIKRQAIEAVPYARLTGVAITKVERGTSEAQLQQRHEVSNHVGTVHAAALFALGEAASGAAMAGALAPVILAARPVASQAQVRYLKPAKGLITARARVRGEPDGLVAEARQQGKTRLDIDVTLEDADKLVVGEMTVEWYVKLQT